MRRIGLLALAGAASIGLAACGGNERNEADNGAATEGAGGGEGSESVNESGSAGSAGAAGAGGTGAAAAADWPRGTRIIEEGGVTYRVNADGERVKLEGNDVRIVTDNGVRYRVNREGNRVRIDERGLDIDVDLPDVTPDVDVGINKKGNPDIDVKTDGDGNDGPN